MTLSGCTSVFISFYYAGLFISLVVVVSRAKYSYCMHFSLLLTNHGPYSFSLFNITGTSAISLNTRRFGLLALCQALWPWPSLFLLSFGCSPHLPRWSISFLPAFATPFSGVLTSLRWSKLFPFCSCPPLRVSLLVAFFTSAGVSSGCFPHLCGCPLTSLSCGCPLLGFLFPPPYQVYMISSTLSGVHNFLYLIRCT